MPFLKRSGVPSEVDQKLKTKRQKIIEEERIRVLRDSIMLFYDKLMGEYELIHSRNEEAENKDINPVSREEVESFVGKYADTKPLGY